MTNDPAPPHLIDAVKASALKLKEKQSVLETRAKELEVLKSQLEAERAELDRRAAKLATDREAVEREKDGLQDVRASMERDLAAINDGRDRLTQGEERLRAELKALEERERAIKADEDRVERLGQSFTEQITQSESRLHNFLERDAELMKLQTDWLAAFETREKELQAISEGMRARQDELVQEHDSLAALKDSFKEELNRLLAEHEALAAKEKSILEAEKFLASALQIPEVSLKEEEEPAAPPQTPAPPEPVAPPPAPEPTPAPEPVTTPVVVPVQEEIPPEEETKPRPTKAEAMERLGGAVEAWKRARDAGWKVSDIRKTVKIARDAIETGDYEAAIRQAKEILEQLQATAAAR